MVENKNKFFYSKPVMSAETSLAKVKGTWCIRFGFAHSNVHRGLQINRNSNLIFHPINQKAHLKKKRAIHKKSILVCCKKIVRLSMNF